MISAWLCWKCGHRLHIYKKKLCVVCLFGKGLICWCARSHFLTSISCLASLSHSLISLNKNFSTNFHFWNFCNTYCRTRFIDMCWGEMIWKWFLQPIHKWFLQPIYKWFLQPIHKWFLQPIHKWFLQPIHKNRNNFKKI